MTNLDMYRTAENENIDILSYKWSNTKARIFEIDNNYFIGIDYNQIKNSIQEKEILAEELGHYYCNALYYINDDKELKNKCEFRAKKWQFKTLVPLHRLKELFEKGYKYTYEIAEELEVTEELVKTAYEYYRENNMIDCY